MSFDFSAHFEVDRTANRGLRRDHRQKLHMLPKIIILRNCLEEGFYLSVPLSLSEVVEAKLVGYFGRIHGIRQILKQMFT